MSKENILFSIIGVLLGFILGFLFTNYVNRTGYGTVATVTQPASSLPSEHPPVNESAAGNKPQGVMPAEIRETLDRAQKNPENFDAQMEAAQLYYKISRFDKALEYLVRANKIKPENVEAIVALGNVNFEKQNYEEAARWYTAALQKNPSDVNVRTDLGLTFMFRNPPDLDRAIAEFNQSLEKNPTHEQTLQNLTVALTRKGNFDRAQSTLSRLEKVNPNNSALTKLKSDLTAKREDNTEG
jgi:tetratricopeptide (TPR) repeat protein